MLPGLKWSEMKAAKDKMRRYNENKVTESGRGGEKRVGIRIKGEGEKNGSHNKKQTQNHKRKLANRKQ